MHKEIERTFKNYSRKTNSDYWILDYRGNKVPTNSAFLSHDDLHGRKGDVNVVTDEYVNRLSPDIINSNDFWKEATTRFPLFSVAGGPHTLETIKDVNDATLYFASQNGVIAEVLVELKKKSKLKILEIGPGHGGFMQSLAEQGVTDTYYAIDVNPLFEHPRLFKTDGKTIPDTIPQSLDMVYSVNVFQHLSKAQRTSYYKQIFDRLRFEGMFLFGMFVVTEDNKDWPCWGYRDKVGGYYCFFFGQLTKIDHIDDIQKELREIGFSLVEQINPYIGKTHYLTFKVVK